jgi:hypothetical protein
MAQLPPGWIVSLLCTILVVASLVALPLIPTFFAQNVYVDENALMPGQASVSLPPQFAQEVVVLERELAPHVTAPPSVLAARLAEAIEALDLQAFVFATTTNDARHQNLAGTNCVLLQQQRNESLFVVSSVLRSGKSDAKESIVLVVDLHYPGT